MGRASGREGQLHTRAARLAEERTREEKPAVSSVAGGDYEVDGQKMEWQVGQHGNGEGDGEGDGEGEGEGEGGMEGMGGMAGMGGGMDGPSTEQAEEGGVGSGVRRRMEAHVGRRSEADSERGMAAVFPFCSLGARLGTWCPGRCQTPACHAPIRQPAHLRPIVHRPEKKRPSSTLAVCHPTPRPARPAPRLSARELTLLFSSPRLLATPSPARCSCKAPIDHTSAVTAALPSSRLKERHLPVTCHTGRDHPAALS